MGERETRAGDSEVDDAGINRHDRPASGSGLERLE
jgi:hypothetical protein